MPGLIPELVQSFIDTQLNRLRPAGFEVTNCLVDTGATAAAMTARAIDGRNSDCIVIGTGLRDSSQLLLFEKLWNLPHEKAPRAKLCFNSSPSDTVEAVQRWITP